MVMVVMIIATVCVSVWFGVRTDPFDVMRSLASLVLGALSTVVVLGVLSWHSTEERSQHEIYEVIQLQQGVAVSTEVGGKYLRYSDTRFTDRCEEPYLTEIKTKTRPYQTLKPMTTSTFYILCIPDQP